MILAQILIISYSTILFVLWLIWLRISEENLSKNAYKNIEISIIIPIRNEAENILALLLSLENQTLPKYNFEVIIINDDSTDDSVKIIENFQKTSKLNLQLIHISFDASKSAPKKTAIANAIKLAQGNYIFATDGDCILPKKILEKYISIFQNSEIQFISGPVTFISNSKNSFWINMQIVEFASLIGVAATSIFLKSPNMCSGANIAYRKSAFYEVGGYDDNLKIASGDDEFLMHKIALKYPNGIKYCKSEAAIVQTQACESVAEFYQQRKRWASKWQYYRSLVPKILAVFIFAVNMATIFIFLNQKWDLIFLRLFFEIIFISTILIFLKKPKSILFIPIVQIIYPFYVILFGLTTLFAKKEYVWKNRNLK